jgi:hypothetical protein
MAFHVPEKFRVRQGKFATDERYGNNGAFICKVRRAQKLNVIASAEMGWEHVSVSTPTRCPTWEEMCQIKDLFWDDTDCVVQYHPPRSEYVNNHPYCLHLWKPIGIPMPMPHSILVGTKNDTPAKS